MGKRRMFSLDVIDTDLFIEMPQSSRLLYYELCMRADDDGFVSSPKKIMKMVGCGEDDFKVLITKQFILPFDTGIIVIRHWKIHNYIQKDRYKETLYTKQKQQLIQEKNGVYELKSESLDTDCIQDGYTGKVSIGKVNIEKNNTYAQNFELFWKAYPKKRDKGNAEKWFKKNNPSTELVETMVKQIERFKDTQEWKKQDGQFIPYPTTWLNAKMWEDEFETDTEKEKRIEEEIIGGTYGA